MQDPLEAMNIILMIYAIPCIFILLAGIVVIIIGYGKEKKPLKIAGLVISIVAFKVLVLLGCIAVYFRFIESLTGA